MLHVVAFVASVYLLYNWCRVYYGSRAASSSAEKKAGCPAKHVTAKDSSREYGKFKYCGLREDPIASGPPPMYSKDPLNIPVPQMTPDEQGKLGQLAARVADVMAGAWRLESDLLLRFLREAKGDVQRAEKRLRTAGKWREEWDVDRALTHWNLEAYEQCLAPWWLSGGFLGHGLQGEPVAYERLGRCDWARICSTVPWEILQRLDIVHAQRCIAALEEDAQRRGRSMPVIVIMDMEGYGWDQVKFSAAMKFSQLTVGRDWILQDWIGKMLVVNAPPACLRAWALFKHLLNKDTLTKVEIVGTDCMPMLRRYVDESEIAGFLGGKRCIDGDPQCARVLAPGGFPPKEALDRLTRLLKEDGHLRRESRAHEHSSPSAKACASGQTLRQKDATGCFAWCHVGLIGRLVMPRKLS